MNNDMIKELYSIGLIPVIKIENPDDAVPLAKALIDGGLPAAEITFRTKCAAEAIKNITDAYPEMFVGAGTVLTTEQVDAAIAAAHLSTTSFIILQLSTLIIMKFFPFEERVIAEASRSSRKPLANLCT